METEEQAQGPVAMDTADAGETSTAEAATSAAPEAVVDGGDTGAPGTVPPPKSSNAARGSSGSSRSNNVKIDYALTRIGAIEGQLAGISLSMGVLNDLLARVTRLELKDAEAPAEGVDHLDGPPE